MKKKYSKIFSLLLSILLLFSSACPVYAANNATYDYGDINTLPNKYSYGTLFWSDNTKIIDYSSCSYKKTDNKYRFGAKKGEFIKVKITNCAVDEDGDLCDVIVTIDNIKAMRVAPIDNYLVMVFNDTDTLNKVGIDNVIRNNLTIDKYNNLVRFDFATNHASADFKMTYLKSGTSDPANIKANASFVYDIDINIGKADNYSDYAKEIFNGNEGFMIPEGKIYYSKNSWLTDTSEGIGVQTPSTTECPVNSNAPELLTSAVVTENFNDSTYRMSYSGRKCGILYMFASPYTFELDAPEKSASNNIVYEGEIYNYQISQYIPNNYYSDVFNFIPNAGGKYKSFVISDKLNENLIVKKEDIKITNESGKNTADYFNISIDSENVLNISAKENILKDISFYSHKYIFSFSANIKSGAGKVFSSISNSAQTTAVNNIGQEIKKSNAVDVSLKYNVTVNGKITNGIISVNNGSSSQTAAAQKTVNHSGSTENTFEFKTDAGYKISNVFVDGTEISLDKISENNGVYTYTFKDQNVISNIEHNIVINTVLKDTSVVSNYFDENGKPIAESKTLYGKIYDSYSTEEKNIYGYILKEIPDNAKGEMTENTIAVNYVYKLKDTNIEVRYIDKNGNELAEPIDIYGKVFDEYTSEPKNFEGYTLVELPENATGTMTEDKITVTYLYELKTAAIKVNYIDINGKTLADSITITDKYYSDYTTDAKNIYGYSLTAIPDNSKGKITEDLITVNYIYELKPSLVIVKYVDEEGKELVDNITIKGQVFDKYNTQKKNIEGYTLTTVPDNATGTMTEENITVTYVYSKNKAPAPSVPDKKPKADKTIKSPKTGADVNLIIFAALSLLIGMVILLTIKKKQKALKQKGVSNEY